MFHILEPASIGYIILSQIYTSKSHVDTTFKHSVKEEGGEGSKFAPTDLGKGRNLYGGPE